MATTKVYGGGATPNMLRVGQTFPNITYPAAGDRWYYVNPTTGNDATAEATARGSWANPLATIGKALTYAASNTVPTWVFVENGATTVETGAGNMLRLGYNIAYKCTVLPRVFAGPGKQGFTITSGGAYTARFVGNIANLEFRNAAFGAGASQAYALYCYNDLTTINNLTFTDCSFISRATSGGYPFALIRDSSALAITNLTLRRCSFTTAEASYAVLFNLTAASSVTGLLIEDCTVVTNGFGIYILNASGSNIQVIGGSYTTTGAGVAMHIGTQSTRGSRITNILVRDTIIKASGSHGLYINGDNVVVSGNVCIGGDYPLVTKWGTDYIVKDNYLLSGTGASLRIKGVADSTYSNNTILAISGASGVYASNNNDEANLPNSNTVFTNNLIVCEGTASPMNWLTAADDAGAPLVVDYNRYLTQTTTLATHWEVSDDTNVLNLAGAQAAWAAIGRVNDLNSIAV